VPAAKAGKAPAPPAKGAKGAPAPASSKAEDALYPARPRNFGIGNDQQPKKRDLSRFVKWPRNVRIQRQRKVLYERLKVPPAINQFAKPLDRAEALPLFKLLAKYAPEDKAAKKDRLLEKAKRVASGGEALAGPKPLFVKAGLNHVTKLVEQKKAKLVVIACDVNPVELVVWLPALCRKMEVPYVIANNKGRLGSIVHMKTAAALALTEVKPEDAPALEKLVDMADAKFRNNAESRRKWGGGVMGLKTQVRIAQREKLLAAEAAKKALL